MRSPCCSAIFHKVRLQRRIEKLLDEAEDAISRHDWAIVHDRAQSVFAIDPDHDDGQALLAVAERGLGSFSQALLAVAERGLGSFSQALPAMHQSAQASSAPETQPISFANGRYEVKRFLGEGGKKRVYLAQGTLLDREVAFALIKTEGLDETSRTRIQREAQAMGRLGSHPHIVTVFGLGEEGNQPYLVTELMGGGDVEGVIEDAEGHRLPLEQAI